MPGVTAVRTSVLPPYAAQLRVYEPLAAYPEPERARWQAYAAEHGPDAEGAAEPVAAAALAEQRQALAELAGRTPGALPDRESGRALVRVVDRVTYICPWTVRLRSWQAMDELRAALPAFLLDTVLPPAVRAEAEADQARWRTAHPDARPWILTSRWEVPVRWCLPFGEEDRHFVPAGPGRTTGDRPVPASLFYLTPMAQARRRVARGYRALRTAVPGSQNGPGGELVLGVEQVGRWLEEFHPRSLVELDYGGLVHLLGAERLAAERSVAEVEAGIGALRAGDTAAAVRAYEAVTARWRRVLALRHAS
ncbi:hypothetical protein [Kitasatospora sp. DSM 101779]|uniref:hypothetical protein n=1 Tax=Kitasatospora sp. DSM 101779 TaxID=2853165 RepID=UPI0021DAB1F3|nr:hypothetical protein [Kitasatospora sp. DSM 101779]MCU7823513.1 hypothetical protein [Kitasatospora sp. DSM 101779]